MVGQRGVWRSVVYFYTWAFAFLFLAAPLSAADWFWANPEPHGNTIRGLAFCGSTWVAVGENGTAWTSSDGIAWRMQTTGINEPLNGVACNGSTLVAVGYQGAVVSSLDGVTWVPRTSGVDKTLMGVAWVPPGSGYDGVFVAVGDELVVLTSPDGASWSVSSAANGNSEEHLWDVAVNDDGSLVVATGGNCYSSCEVSTMMVSGDHTASWTATTYTVEEYGGIVNGVAWGAPVGETPIFVTAHDNGSVVTSPDGVNWTPVDTGSLDPMMDVAWDGQQFVACSFGGKILTSPDGVDWIEETVPLTNRYFWFVASGGGLSAAGGQAGSLVTSPDGMVWTTRMASSGFTEYLSDVAWNGSTAVTVARVSSSGYAVSSNGWSWTYHEGTIGISPSAAEAVGWAPVAPSGLFVSVGRGGRIVTSPDGTSWTQQTSDVMRTLRGIAWDGTDVLVVGSSGTLITSANGIDWSPVDPDTTAHLYDAVCGGGTCVAVGSGVISTRSGGVWASQVSTESWQGVASNGDIFVTVGYLGAISTSVDGVVWTPRVSGTEEYLYDVEFLDGLFIAVGAVGTILTSSDGIDWAEDDSSTSMSLRGIASGLPIAVGSNGAIIQRALFVDSFEFGDVSAWSNSVP